MNHNLVFCDFPCAEGQGTGWELFGLWGSLFFSCAEDRLCSLEGEFQ